MGLQAELLSEQFKLFLYWPAEGVELSAALAMWSWLPVLWRGFLILGLVLIPALHVHLRPTCALRCTAHDHSIQFPQCLLRLRGYCACVAEAGLASPLAALSAGTGPQRSLSKCVAIITKPLFLVCIPVCKGRSKHALVKMHQATLNHCACVLLPHTLHILERVWRTTPSKLRQESQNKDYIVECCPVIGIMH